MIDYVAVIVGLAAIYAILTLALNIQFGLAGLVNFGIVAYFAVGAYTYAIFTQAGPSSLDQYRIGLGGPAWAGVVLAIVAAVLFAAVTSWPCLRLRGDYLALMTFAFAEVLQAILVNEPRIANGSRGLYNVVPPFYYVLPVDSYDIYFALITLGVLAVATLLSLQLKRSHFGLTLRGIRDDELAAASVGKLVNRFRLAAFLVGAGIAGVAGVLDVWFTTIAQPAQFGTDVTFVAFVALVLGGTGSTIGSVVGAFTLFGLQQVLQLMPLDPDLSQRMSSLRVAVLGLLVILVLRFRPRGLFGSAL
ncbi:MAG: branched-chain amino acid ABC transporter permease [Candidatus Acidiferrales bacterium]